ncbi:transposase [Actinomadura madurae]|uniref:transposase n=1 Tax=Actinomadura madurae TaxID=1993 RepID=UPI003FD86B1B
MRELVAPRPDRCPAADHLRRLPGPGRSGRVDTAQGGWQRCRTHYLRNLLPRVLKSVQLWEATLVRTIFDQPPPKTSMPQHAHVVAWLETEHPDAAEHLGAPPRRPVGLHADGHRPRSRRIRVC